MFVVIILIVLGLVGFCILASDDLKERSNLTIHSWVIVIMLVAALVGCLFIYQDWLRTKSIRDYTEGKYKLEQVVYSDTTYIIRKK